ncbi:NB-ARC domain-containing protein [Nocardia brasiliensis]
MPSRGDQIIERPSLTEPLLEMLCAPMPVVDLHGGGGFGKTTIAAAMCHHPRIVERFPDGVLWVTLGRMSDAELAAKSNDLALGGYSIRRTPTCGAISPDTFSSADMAQELD